MASRRGRLLTTAIPRRSAGATVLVAAACLAADADAQTDERLQVQQFRPMPGQQFNYLHVPRAATAPAGSWELGLTFNYARNPLVIQTIDANDRSERTGVLVRSHDVFDLLGFFAISDWFDVGVAIPLYVYDAPGTSDGAFDRFAIGERSRGGLGDVRIVPRLRLLEFGGATDGPNMVLGVSADVMLPTASHPDRYQGESFRAEPRVAWDWTPKPWATWTLYSGLMLRADRGVVDNITAGPSMSFGTAAIFNVDAHEKWYLVPEVVGLVAFAKGADVDLEEVPLEFRGAARYFPIERLMVEAGIGAGIIEGFGTPDWRLLAGVTYSGPAEVPGELTCQSTDRFPDEDSDDVCETPDSFALECDMCRPREDGAYPDPAQIGSFVERDAASHYWRVAYYANMNTDDRLDIDGDGWSDACDLCRPQDACSPDASTDDGVDTDGDGIPDGCDLCADGGDLADRDSDCIVDCLDECPDEPETWNDVDDQDGCPEPPPQCAESDVCPENLGEFPFVDAIYGGVPFFFDYDVHEEFSARPMRGYDRDTNEALLDQIAIVLQSLEPCLRYQLRAEGHTDTDGNAEYNDWLGEQRALRVIRGLIDRGVNPDNLSASTFGKSSPLNPDDQGDDYAPGNRENRRVILRIVGCAEEGERATPNFEPVCSPPTGRRCRP